MKKIFLCLFLAHSFPLLAQHHADNWYFGVLAGIDFSTFPPTILTDGALYTVEGCASMSDTSGNLLFYTNGVDVYNSQHSIMPNGSGLYGGISSTQSSLMVPHPNPDSSNIYFIFTTEETGNPNGFCYSKVDISLQGGLGDVTTKNISLLTPVVEKLTAVTTEDLSKTWIVVHEWGTNAFYAYALTSSGFNATPVISNTGIVHNTSIIQNTYGQMKFAPCGNRLGVAVAYQDTVELFDFNMATGTVYNPVTIPMPDHIYGL